MQGYQKSQEINSHRKRQVSMPLDKFSMYIMCVYVVYTKYIL